MVMKIKMRALPPRKMPPIMATMEAPMVVTMLSIATPTIASPMRPLGLMEKLWTTIISPKHPIIPAITPEITNEIWVILLKVSMAVTMVSAANNIPIPDNIRLNQVKYNGR